MAQQQKKKPAAGGGKTANSEPRVQAFTQFAGCHFQLAPQDLSIRKYGENGEPLLDHKQSDLQMTYLAIQNNVDLAANKTLETRVPSRKLLDAPEVDYSYTGVAACIGRRLFLGVRGKTKQEEILVHDTSDPGSKTIRQCANRTTSGVPSYPKTNTISAIGNVDSHAIVLTEEGKLYKGSIDKNDDFFDFLKVPNPEPLTMANVHQSGTKDQLKLSGVESSETPYRIGICHTYVNELGPTLPSEQLVFYASKPTTEWTSTQCVIIGGKVPEGYDIKAVELYYTEGNYQEPNFLGRAEVGSDDDFSFVWTGYLTDTSTWTISNLQIPSENYTEGIPASKFTQIDGRVYFWGSKKYPDRLWIGGNPGNLLSVSPGTGGGFIDVEPGVGNKIREVLKYKTQSGNSIVTILCDNENSTLERRYNLIEDNVSLSTEQSVKGWHAERVDGAVGCKSYNGAGVWADGLYAVSRYGLSLTTLTMEYNSQIRTTYVSDPIKPAFTDLTGKQLSESVIICIDDVIYFCFGRNAIAKDEDQYNYLDEIIFCYDIDLKAWWTYTFERDDIKTRIKNIINLDWEGNDEGLCFIADSGVFVINTSGAASIEERMIPFQLSSGELATNQPSQNMQHLTQFEFRFDYFVGEMNIVFTCIDQFGRRVVVKKNIEHGSVQYNLHEYMRIGLVVESYKLEFTGEAAFRMTHFMAKTYPKPSKVGIVWGFDSSSNKYDSNGKTLGTIHHYFKSYNDIRKAIIP